MYNTIWDNRQFSESFDALALSGGDTVVVNALATYFGVKERHTGVELDFTYRPFSILTLNGMASVGNWEFKGDFGATLVNVDTEDPLIGDTEVTVFADGLKVGDAAQTTFSLGATLEPVVGLKIYGNYYYAGDLYAQFSILEDQFKKTGGQVVQLPTYSLVDAGASYTFDFNKTSLTIRLNINNVLDETYVAEMDTNVADDPSTSENEFYTKNQGFYGFGRTWNAGVKFSF